MKTPVPLVKPPYAAPWLAPYWEGLRNHELRLPRCSVCSRWEWYPVADQPACSGGHYIWEVMGDEATLFTFTHVERPLLPDVMQPYWVGLVIFNKAPLCRIPSLLDPGQGIIRIGARLRLAFAGEGDKAFPYFKVVSK